MLDAASLDPKQAERSPALDLAAALLKGSTGRRRAVAALQGVGTTMQMRDFGRTGLKVSILGFGCGAVGGLMVRGAPADQERAVAHAIEAGINYFDTASQYGNGASETNLGRILKKLKPDVIVGTKVRLDPDADDIAGEVSRSLEASLRRLQMDRVDIFHLHNPITRDGGGGSLPAETVLDEVAAALERLRQQGKTRFIGITAIGDTAALHEIIGAGSFQSAQVSFNMLNPSAADPVPPGYPGQDYDRLLDRAAGSGAGTIGIRALAGGALSGDAARHPIASPPPEPIGSATSYAADLERAQRLLPLVREGFADSLAEASLRFVSGSPLISTMLVGIATLDQLEQAIAAVEKGPLPPEALRCLAELHREFAGEAR
ncbi:MAG TPA: aldo/keto reductase [Acetobacteraceae bacterium]|nr:aldo/keto reductase [Acetobacteraceae bacterium]